MVAMETLWQLLEDFIQEEQVAVGVAARNQVLLPVMVEQVEYHVVVEAVGVVL
jgi:hypothetical protein